MSHGPAKRVQAVSVFSSRGRRPAQEDHVLLLQEKGIFVVADGFGGPVPGAAAARVACESVRDFLVKEAGDLDATLPFELRTYYSLAGNVLFNSVVHANRKVRALNKEKNVHEKGGASLLAGFLDGGLLALANVGACTAWLLRGGECRELVVPRTYARLADPFAADPRGDGRVPLMAVGMSSDLEPEIFECQVRPDDWLVIATDGFTAEIREAFCRIQAEGMPPETAAQAVLKDLNARQFSNNSSVSLIII